MDEVLYYFLPAAVLLQFPVNWDLCAITLYISGLSTSTPHNAYHNIY